MGLRNDGNSKTKIISSSHINKLFIYLFIYHNGWMAVTTGIFSFGEKRGRILETLFLKAKMVQSCHILMK